MRRISIPVWISSIVFGLLIVETITRVWSLLAVTNLRSTPEIPWSVVVMSFVLWAAWKYLGGSWPPQSLTKLRTTRLRANQIEPGQRTWAWTSAALLGFLLIQLIVISTRLFDYSSGQVQMIERVSVFPAWTVIVLIVMTSLVAGVSEEAGFRGYMQKPMEARYGPAIAIPVVAIVFTLIHLPNATIIPHLIPIFFIGSLGWGMLAYLSDSIVPGVVLHSLVDLVGLTFVWMFLEEAKSMASESVFRDGMDLSFAVVLATASLTLALLCYSFLRIARSS